MIWITFSEAVVKVRVDSQQNSKKRELFCFFCNSKWAILLNFVKNQYFRHKGGFHHFVSFSSKTKSSGAYLLMSPRKALSYALWHTNRLNIYAEFLAERCNCIASSAIPIRVCLSSSVSLSVTQVSCDNKAEARIMQFSLKCSPMA